MSSRIVLAGTGTVGHAQNHQLEQYVPATGALADADVVGVIAGSDAKRANELAAAAGVELVNPEALDADLIIACPDLGDLSSFTGLLDKNPGIPVLLDKPTLLEADVLDDLAARYPAVIPAHPWRFHPALTTALGRVRTGGLGLLHAVHGELIVGAGDGPHPLGELRNLAVHALDVTTTLIGPLQGRARAVVDEAGPDGAGQAITLSLRCQPDVAVTLLVARTAATSPASLHRYRILGSHGQLLVDLDSPAFDVISTQVSRLPFGPSSVQRLIEAALAGSARHTLADAAAIGHIISQLERSAADGQAVSL